MRTSPKHIFLLVGLISLSVLLPLVRAESAEQQEPEAFYLQVKDHEFIEETAKNNPNGYFVFFGADWCGHCQRFKPVFANLAKKIKQGEHESTLPTFIHYNVDSRDAVISMFRVTAFPTLYFIKNNKMCLYHGDRSEDALLRFFRETDTTTAPQCTEYAAEYPGWKQQAFNLWGEVKHELVLEYGYYSQEYPKITYSVLTVVAFCCLIILTGFFICMKDIFAPRKTAIRHHPQGQEPVPRPRQPADQKTQGDKSGSADTAEQKKEK